MTLSITTFCIYLLFYFFQRGFSSSCSWFLDLQHSQLVSDEIVCNALYKLTESMPIALFVWIISPMFVSLFVFYYLLLLLLVLIIIVIIICQIIAYFIFSMDHFTYLLNLFVVFRNSVSCWASMWHWRTCHPEPKLFGRYFRLDSNFCLLDFKSWQWCFLIPILGPTTSY